MRIVNLVESQPRRGGWWVGVNRAGVGQTNEGQAACIRYRISCMRYGGERSERACEVTGARDACRDGSAYGEKQFEWS